MTYIYIICICLSQSKQERDSDDDIDIKDESELDVLPKISDKHWHKLHFGSFDFSYRVKKVTPIHGLSSLIWSKKTNYVLFTNKKKDYKLWFNGLKKELDEIFMDSISEMHDIMDTKENPLKIKKITKWIDANNKDKEKGGDDKLAKTVSSRVLPMEGNHYNVECGEYITHFDIDIVRFHLSFQSNYHFKSGFGATLSIICGNKEIFDDYQDTKTLIKEYSDCNKENKLTLLNVLNFSCKYQYKVTQKMINEQSKYGLNVKLHEYQMQSIEHMIKEENDPIGIYRHFYKLGHFDGDNKDIFFYYSSAFNELLINQHLPVIHGGFLCEEMGLGKTIESMALINYNQRRDGECSTNKKLIIGLKEKNKHNPRKENIYYKSGATLIIAPVSLVGQWEKECVERSDKKIRFKRYYASSRKRQIGLYIDQDIVFTTYGIIGKENGSDRVRHILHLIDWHRIILDESHYIKNGHTICSNNMHNLRARNKWLLSGTPVLYIFYILFVFCGEYIGYLYIFKFGRQIDDIYNQLKFIGFEQRHLDNHINLKILRKMQSRGQMINNQILPLLKILKYCMMRHKKQQQFNDKDIVKMTEKVEDIIYVEFDPNTKQKEYYDKLYNIAKERYEIYKATGNVGRGSIALLSSLLPARQACSGHIYSMDEIENELSRAQAKTYRVNEMVNDIANRDKTAQQLYEMALVSAYNENENECPICYETPFDAPLQTICRHIFCGECITSILREKNQCPMCRKKCSIKQLRKPPSQKQETIGDDNKKDKMDVDQDEDDKKEKQKKEEQEEEEKKEDDLIKFDTKLNLLLDAIKKLNIEKPNDKSLIFTSFSKSLDWICKELEKNKIQYRTLTGSMSMNKRKKALQEFSDNKNVKVFVLTVRSGAVGITLTAANHVFIMEPPFNPALYRQAINRVYRLGQKKKVFCHTLIMKNSIEEKIWNINEQKQNDKDGNKLKTMAGNINADKHSKLQQHEISKLFEEQ